MTLDARQESLSRYSHVNVRDRYDADLLMAGFQDGAAWAQDRARLGIRQQGPIEADQECPDCGEDPHECGCDERLEREALAPTQGN